MTNPQPQPPQPEKAPLHEDDPAAATDDGAVRNLTAEEYAATWAQGEPERLPDDVLAALPTGEEQDR